MVKKAIAIGAMIVVCFAMACAGAAPAPTPTPEPTPTPVELLATKAEDLAGLWFAPFQSGRGMDEVYYRFEPGAGLRPPRGDIVGLVIRASSVEELRRKRFGWARFWFEDGVYYEEGSPCDPVGSYRVYLQIEEGRAVYLRFDEIDDRDRSCWQRSWEKRVNFVRVD